MAECYTETINLLLIKLIFDFISLKSDSKIAVFQRDISKNKT